MLPSDNEAEAEDGYLTPVNQMGGAGFNATFNSASATQPIATSTPQQATNTSSALATTQPTQIVTESLSAIRTLAVPRAPSKLPIGKEYTVEELRQSQGICISQQPFQQLATMYFQRVFDAIEKLDEKRCFMCLEKSCFGLRDSSRNKMCRKRMEFVEHTSGLICFGCGGPHMKQACQFRSGSDRPPVPADRRRCFLCMLPQHAINGISFHEQTENMSGTEVVRERCKNRGDRIFSLLSAFYFSKEKIYNAFVACHESNVIPPVPHFSDHRRRTDGFSVFWNWLWTISNAKEPVYHIDIVLSFMFLELDNFGYLSGGEEVGRE
jgi:hypothetical protein